MPTPLSVTEIPHRAAQPRRRGRARSARPRLGRSSSVSSPAAAGHRCRPPASTRCCSRAAREGGDELASVAEDDETGSGSWNTSSMSCWSADARMRSIASAMTSTTGHELARRRALRLEAREVEQVVDDPAHPEGLEVDALGEPRCATAGSRSTSSVSASRPSAPIGVFSSWLTFAMKSRRISSRRRRSETSSIIASTPSGRRPSSMSGGADREGAPRRSVEVDGALGAAAVPRLGQQLGDGLGGDRVAVATRHELVGVLVAVQHGAGLVAQHEPERERVERAAQPDRLGARLGDRLGGRAGDLLEVAEGSLDAAVVRRRVLAPSREPSAESRWAIARRSRAPTDERADEDGDDGDAGGGSVERRRRPGGRRDRVEHGSSMADRCRSAAGDSSRCGAPVQSCTVAACSAVPARRERDPPSGVGVPGVERRATALRG